MLDERASTPPDADELDDDRDPPAEWIATAHLRQPPDYVIIGAQRAGTTSLYKYLCDHPHVGAAYRKEVHYFDRFYDKGWAWYLAHFPQRGQYPVVGEASPFYLFHPEVPHRLRVALPAAKLIVLLRNPIDRALSQYHQKRRKQNEDLGLEEALAREEERLADDDDPVSAAWRHHSYLRRGYYAEQLERWFAVFPRDRFLILRSEEFFADPVAGLHQAQAFLGLEPAMPKRLKAHHMAEYPPMDAALRRRLADHFAPHNARLAQLLGRRFGWDE